MQPNQPVPPSPNQFDFITNPRKPPRRSLLNGSSYLGRILIIIGGAAVLMIIVSVVLSLFGGGQTDTNALKSLVAEQQELARVAAVGANKAGDTALRAKAKIAELSATTQQESLMGYLEVKGIKLSKEELAAAKDSGTDQALESAESSNHFDEVFNETLSKMLAKYLNSLQTAHQNAGDDELKNLLNSAFKSTGNIIGTSETP